jgi:hypothetical protein
MEKKKKNCMKKTGDHDIVGKKMLEYTFLIGNSLHTGST